MKIASLFFLPLALAAPAPLNRRANPTVTATAAQATVVGTSILGVESFKGIPYAQPPVGQLRLKPPQPLSHGTGQVDGTGIPMSCPQFFFSVDKATFPFNLVGDLLNTPLFQTITLTGEDCLTVNVQRPAGTQPGDKLPVLFWIFGGGFELGSTATYDATSLVKEAVSDGQPVVFVAVNYRLGGFGFMPGKEVLADGSANLGLLDQRLGLQWVADNIADFGGDPDKVTIWGESAGSISVLDQMMMYDGDINYKGKPLFRGGIMDSGSVTPADPVDCPKGQAVYDTVVQAAGCSGVADTLDCLRNIPYEKFLQAANTVPGILSHFTVNLSYFPRPDGKVLTQSPDILASSGTYAEVPFIVGDQEDEGTLFALFTGNITTQDEISDYLGEVFFHHASKAQMDEMVSNYPNIWEFGSPFRTGIFNNIFPQFKRMAAILGDMTFTLTRRTFLDTNAKVHPNVPSWSYLSSYDYLTPVMGTFHATDILQVFYGLFPNNAAKTTRGYYLNFVYNLDPNVGNSYDNWPLWSDSRQLMNFNAHSNQLINDDFRKAASDFLINNAADLRV